MSTQAFLKGNEIPSSNDFKNVHRETLALESEAQLSNEEETSLNECEKLIETRMLAFFEVGEALIRIKEGKLYRSRFATFDEYCHKRWDFNRMYAYRLLHAVQVRRLLAPPETPLRPENERQIRPLVGLPPKVAEKAWVKAVELADGRNVTGAVVLQAVRTVTRSREPKVPEKESWQLGLARLLKKAVQRCHSGDREEVTDLVNKMQLLLEVGLKRVGH